MEFSPDFIGFAVEQLGLPMAMVIGILWALSRGHYVSKAHLDQVVSVMERENARMITLMEIQAADQEAQIQRLRAVAEWVATQRGMFDLGRDKNR